MPTEELTESPNLGALYLKAAGTAPLRRAGRDAGLPDTEYVRSGITVDRDHLAEYNRLCGFGTRDELPITYPHITSFPLAVRLMTDRDFPFPLVGLVHVANRITRYHHVLVTDPMTQRVRLANPRRHPKGRQFDVITETSVGDRLVWTETSTYLRRSGSDESAPRPEGVSEVAAGTPTATWRLPANLGRRYAAVSGDRNPIHLSPLTAKAFGFPRTIAHGMWSKARCLATFEGRLPEACSVEVEFAKPVLLPSRVDFTERPGGSGKLFALHSASGKPHLKGRWSSEPE
ncbi:MaoC like domain-containing protein [Actinopolyspora xinjiangensis]|uniref:MaoC like domain-containing protein n=1 Tax=Actinopolyspora xinjiangensis TaxID=405564 RepID=A0A1H0V9C6_9ACTN|nr:MaoC/PaaZ C-terminal domain-containing protein [Actinopolyspora xinjiangensis]SDP75179.1 MaoC like domain-containing protein [Actinopolyspora xinjiangensis]